MKQENQNFLKLLEEKLLPNIVPLVAAFLFSTAFLGGFKFLFFDARTEMTTFYSQKKFEIAQRTNELSLGQAVSNIYDKGWFANKDNYEKLNAIYIELIKQKENERLDPDLVEESIKWYQDIITQLISEKGEIKGVVFEHKGIKTEQENILKAYELQIKLTEELFETITKWSEEDIKEHQKRLDLIETILKESLELSNSSKQYTLQLQAQLEAEKVQKELDAELIEEEFRKFRLKLTLSSIGVSTGFVALIILIWNKGISKFLKRKKGELQKTSRKKK